MLFITEGILIGLTLAILIGPIFITLMQISMQSGIKAGLIAGIGIWISDLIVIFLAWWGIQKINHWLQNPSFLFWQSIIGGAIIMIVGMVSLMTRQKAQPQQNLSKLRSRFSFFYQGFLVNFINPFTFVFWITMLSTRAMDAAMRTSDLILFFGAIIGTIITTDTLKVILAKKISNRLSPYHISIVQVVASLVLVVFGIFIIIQVF
ncbi:MAG: LysE family translocator [Chitinophagales bacterium]|nr:LysE family translocator [Chitinophagales bacterium]